MSRFSLTQTGKKTFTLSEIGIGGPFSPIVLSVVSYNDNEINLSWINTMTQWTNYRIYYSTDGTTYISDGTTTSTTYTFSATAETSYYLKVTAYYGNYEVGMSNIVNVTTWAAIYTSIRAAMSVEPSDDDAAIQSTLAGGLVSGGFIDDAEFIYILAAHYGGGLVNWANPGTFDLSLQGTAFAIRDYLGYCSFADNSYLKTGFIPSTSATKITKDNVCLIIGVGTPNDNSSSGGECGTYADGSRLNIMANYNNKHNYTCFTSVSSETASAGSLAHFAMSRTASTGYRKFRNKVGANVSDASVALPSKEFLICARNDNGTVRYAPRFVRYVALLKYQTDAKIEAFIDLMETYLSNYNTNLISPTSIIATGNPATKEIIPLTTYDGSGQTIHPSVIDCGADWNGYRYWMCNTPLSGDSAYENPSMWGSVDGQTFVVPDGLTNPVIPKPSGNFNADPDLYFESNRMYIFYKEHPNCKMSYSDDSVNWSALTLIKTPDADATEVRSPSVIKVGSKYYLYYVPSGSGSKMRRVSADSISGPYSNVEECEFPDYTHPAEDWHIDVIYSGGYYWLSAGYDAGIYIYKSSDGVTFYSGRQPVCSWYDAGDNGIEHYYRSSLCEIGGQMYVYYSALTYPAGSLVRTCNRQEITLI